MHGIYERNIREQTEIERSIRQGTAKIVSRKFPIVAKALWPFKTAAELAAIANTSERAAARWLSGEHDPPISVVLAVMRETFG